MFTVSDIILSIFFFCVSLKQGASLVVQWQRICLPMQETWVQPLGREGPLEKEMATKSNILAWRISWTEEPGGLGPWGFQTLQHDLATKQ